MSIVQFQSSCVSSSSVEIVGASRVMARIEQLAKITALDVGVCRTYLTAEHQRANALVLQWMCDAGMTGWVDPAGNCWGRYNLDNEPLKETVILGSHLDTVVNAGKYDGILGVLCAIEIVDSFFRQKKILPFIVDVVGFADEEGTRFGATLLGSRAVAGSWDNNWWALQDKDGISLAEAMTSFGLSPDNIDRANRRDDSLLAYLELHIEQGPVLEKINQPVGVVTSIAGARRFTFQLTGMAGHAGTVPMDMRRDPLVAAAQIIVAIEAIAQQSNVVATVGTIEALPGAVNVIAGACHLSLDLRSGQDSVRDAALEKIVNACADICHQRNIKLDINEIHNASAVSCASWIEQLMQEVISDCGLTSHSLVSGAGHDAMAFDGVTDVGMLFVRCTGGISHNPAESVTHGDVDIALNVFARTVLAMADKHIGLMSFQQ